MGKHYRCVIGKCDNEMQYSELHKKHSNMHGNIVIHKSPKDEFVKAAWIHTILKGRKDLKSEKGIPKTVMYAQYIFVRVS